MREAADVAEAFARLDEDTRAVVLAAYDWGYRAGWRAGYARSFEDSPAAGVKDLPTREELDTMAGEVRLEDGTRTTIPRANDYPGGPVAPW